MLDVGCGVGYLTFELAKMSQEVVGVDPSSTSIDRARSRFTRRNLAFHAITPGEYKAPRQFDVVVANMTFQVVWELDDLLGQIAGKLVRDGELIFSVPHPWFWPFYWQYYNASWFHYAEELSIEHEFQITSEKTGVRAVHVHRPLSRYFSALDLAGFELKEVLEPVPSVEATDAYRTAWEFPRFLLAKARLR